MNEPTHRPTGSGAVGRRIPWDDYIAMHVREIVLAVVVIVGLVLAFLFLEIPGGDELVGSVTSGGRPVVYGTVTVVASDDRVYSAAIRPDGTYRIPAVPPGPVRVAVSSPNPRSIVDQMGAAESAAAGPAAGAASRPGASGAVPAGAGTRGGPSAAAGGRGAAAAKDDPAADSVSVAAPNGTAPPFPAAAPPTSRAEQRPGWFRIPGRYASPTTSGIRTEMRRGRTPLDIRVD